MVVVGLKGLLIVCWWQQIEHQDLPTLNLQGLTNYKIYWTYFHNFNAYIVQQKECSINKSCDALQGLVFNSWWCYYFWWSNKVVSLAFQQNYYGMQVVPWNPWWICLHSIWNPVKSMWNPCGIHVELIIPQPFHPHSTWNPWCPWKKKLAGVSANIHSMDSIWNNLGKVKTLQEGETISHMLLFTFFWHKYYRQVP